MSCLQARWDEASVTLDYLAVVKALEVFQIPQPLWPPVMLFKQRLQHQVEAQLKASYPEAQALLDQICALLPKLAIEKPANDFWQDGVTAAVSHTKLIQSIQAKLSAELQHKEQPIRGYSRAAIAPVVVTLLSLDHKAYEGPNGPRITDTILIRQLRTALSILGRQQHLAIRFRGAYLVNKDSAHVPVEVLVIGGTR